MLITNDMALIIFLPLGYFTLINANQRKYLAFTFIMQNFAANLGGMLTPFGNPQNLYLYSYYNIDTIEFIQIMLLPFLVSIFLITVCCLFVKNEDLSPLPLFEKKLDTDKTIIYFLLFIFVIAIIFRYVNYIYGLIIIPLALMILDSEALLDVDYALLFTFCVFFIFSGNVSRMPEISNFLYQIMQKNTLLSGIISSQFISNVPSAILLSKFTTNYRDLLISVNIGGVGTLIASLASLITYREYLKHEPGKQLYYLKTFTIYNFVFLIILTLICSYF